MHDDINIAFDSLGYYWQHPATAEWFGPYNVTREKLLALIQKDASNAR